MRKYLLALVAMLAVVALSTPATFPAAVGASTAHAATTRLAKCNDNWDLHPGTSTVRGSCGTRVADLQWLLGGHKPYAMTAVKPTFRYAPNGAYGARTASAVKAMKFRLGYPQAGQCKQKANMASSTRVGPMFLAIMKNKSKRPACWVGLAAARVKGVVRTGVSPHALAIKALELSQLGVHEVPSGANRGPCISYTCTLGGHRYGPYQGVTGAYGLAWCASFGDWAMTSVVGHGFGASNNAFVPTIALNARNHGWLVAKPKVGSYVVFLTSQYTISSGYHIGFVVKVTATGVQTIEGNSGTAYGGSVREVWRDYDRYHMVYIDFPGVA